MLIPQKWNPTHLMWFREQSDVNFMFYQKLLITRRMEDTEPCVWILCKNCFCGIKARTRGYRIKLRYRTLWFSRRDSTWTITPCKLCTETPSIRYHSFIPQPYMDSRYQPLTLIKSHERIYLLPVRVQTIWDASKCSLFLGVDFALRYIGYSK